ncbi:hypothetical protein GWK08_17715 [Leptobacterium flavescens]|uniref:Uncharacterized protein n=1 Tax=Leptobacterium flavescens TaxID=472055 RepID=A0A6P0UTF9_9FLAO|nr:DUF6588 family protein [Leptobacterium flavescens]NER15298.1 hypothetical protein [Leptobacterium flavescens]
MKKLLFIAVFFLGWQSYAQENIDDLLASGVNDARRFTQSYLDPATEGIVYNLNNGWFNSGKAKKLFGFEISIVANASFVKDENKSFVLDVNDYENLRFQDGSTSREVSTAFGDIEGITVVAEGPLPGAVDDAVFELPTGLGSADINFVPSAFIQGSIGLIKGTELKARYFPKVETDDVNAGLFGFGIQHEITSWLPADKLFPVAISGLIAYTNLDGTYDFTSTSIVSGQDQRLENSTSTWLFQLIGSTKLPVFNVYGGIGYINGKSETDLKGTFNVQSGVLGNQTLVDPFSIENKVTGVRGTVGVRLKLGFFRINADYTLAEYDNVSLALSFGFR